MSRRPLAAVATAALILSLTAVTPAVAAPESSQAPVPKAKSTVSLASATGETAVLQAPEVTLGKKKGRETYTVQLAAPAVPTRALAPTPRGAVPSATAHRREIRSDQDDAVARVASTIGREAPLVHRFTEALNGFSMRLTAAEARRVATLEGVTSVHVDTEFKPLTDAGPGTINAPSIWDGSALDSGTGSKGEGVIVGIIDTGINAANPSFATSVPATAGGDGHVHTNPYGSGNFKGMCDPESSQYRDDFTCTDKLIGAWDFTGAPKGLYYETSHGTHVASTAAGNQFELRAGSGASTRIATIRGVAPHANIISYDVCVDDCASLASAAAVEQAIKDGVDVLNHSIGADDPSVSWHEPYAVAFRNARAAGIHVAQAAGNAGPTAGTVGGPADFPWVTSVAALENGRARTNQLLDLTSGGASLAPLSGLAGRSHSAGTSAGEAPIMLARSSDPDCSASVTGGAYAGAIVVCERVVGAEESASLTLSDAGAAGMVLVDAPGVTPPTTNKSLRVPAIHLGATAGADLLAWLGDPTTVNPRGRIGSSAMDLVTNDTEIADFSSRGPNGYVSGLAPSVAAPGSFVLAAAGEDNDVAFGYMSGTSMASPHVAGALALLAATRPEWTPAQAQSALMTTADALVTENGEPTSAFVQGAGRINLAKAARAGLLADESTQGYLAADPGLGSREQSINAPSFVDDACTVVCDFTLDLSATPLGVGTWTVTSTSDAGVTLTHPASLAVGATGATLTTRAEFAPGARAGDWRFGSVTLTPPSGSSASPAHVPVALSPSGADVPRSVNLRTARADGSVQVSSRFADPAHAAGATVALQGLSRGPVTTGTVRQATDPGNPFAAPARLAVSPLVIPPGVSRIVVDIDSDAPDLDLLVGAGTSPSPASTACFSALEGSQESCDLMLSSPTGITAWIGVHGYDLGGAAQAKYDLRITFVEEGDSMTAETIASGRSLTTTLAWDDERIKPGQSWYGLMTTRAGGAEYRTLVSLGHTDPDVVRTQSASTASFGVPVTHTVAFTPTLSNVEQTYEFSEQLPPGVTRTAVLEEPAPLTHEGATTSWRVTVPAGSARTLRYSYTAQANGNDLVDGADLQHTVTHRRLGGAGRSTTSTVRLSMPEAPSVAPLTSVGEGVREVPVPLERGWTLALLDGSTPTSRIDVDGGTYSVEPGALLRFTPTAGRYGSPTPATYRVTDSVGRHFSSTFAPTVRPAAPGVQDRSTRGGTSQRVSLALETWQSAAFVQDGRPTDRLVTEAGTYAVVGNELTFEAARGVSGLVPPVRFRVSDSHGRSTDSTWTLFVDVEATGTVPAPTTPPTAGPTTGPTTGPAPKPAPKPAAKVKTRLTVKLTKKQQRQGRAPARARITVKSSKGQAKGKVVVRVNGKATRTIKVTKNRTVTVKLSKKLSRGKKTVRVTFVPAASGPSAKATARTTLRVIR